MSMESKILILVYYNIIRLSHCSILFQIIKNMNYVRLKTTEVLLKIVFVNCAAPCSQLK